ncbi:MAG: hypothetical protein HY076_00150, partial [Candidatus Eisenbacteria bacterium]|nr:hypothetical protein [Candidatus Eisenbacteria bacterium]
GHHAVAVTWRHLDGPPARLHVSPVLVARNPNALVADGADLAGATQGVPGRVRIESLAGTPALTLWHGGAFLPAHVQQRGLVYPADRAFAPPARGRSRTAAAPAEASEDGFIPGHLEHDLPVGGAMHVVAAIEDDLFRALAVEGRLGTPPPRTLAECVRYLEQDELARRERWMRAAISGADFTARQAAAAHGGPGEALARRAAPLIDAGEPWVARFAAALTDGLIERDGRMTLLTALPAGAERGAETLRALPALITLRAFEPAREVLRGYVEYLNEGLAPESFDPESGRPRYGDPAPALWLVHAAEMLARRSVDQELAVEALAPAIESIMQAYRSGTRGGIRVAPDGLLWSGEGEAACARPELNALWFHALVAAAQLGRLTGRKESGAFYLAWAREHQKRAVEAFWDEKRGCLFDSLTDAGPRAGIAPSQLLAVSLTPPLLPPPLAVRLVATLERELFTPLGLREASSASVAAPEWIGPFITATLRVYKRSPGAQTKVRGWIETLRAELDRASTAHVPASFAAPRHGDAAARPRGGAPTPGEWPQPVSVLAAAELLRVWIEEIDRAEVPAPVG